MILKSAETVFEMPEPGVYPARLYRIIDLGHQETTWQGETKLQHKILFSFEIIDRDARMSDGRNFSVSRRFTASLAENAALKKFLQGWRGKGITPEEVSQGFDLNALIGKPALLNLVETQRGDRKYLNIDGASPLPRGMVIGNCENELLIFDLAKPDLAVFESLSDGLKKTIEASPEWARFIGSGPLKTADAPIPDRSATAYRRDPPKAPKPEPALAEGSDVPFDDDIPW
jgi:hypothetical protein